MHDVRMSASAIMKMKGVAALCPASASPTLSDLAFILSDRTHTHILRQFLLSPSLTLLELSTE